MVNVVHFHHFIRKHFTCIVSFAASRFQTSHWHDKHAILAAIGIFTHSRQHHHKRWFRHLVRVDLRSQREQIGSTFLYVRVTAYLHLYQPVRAIVTVQHRVALQAIAIAEMTGTSIQRLPVVLPIAHQLCAVYMLDFPSRFCTFIFRVQKHINK